MAAVASLVVLFSCTRENENKSNDEKSILVTTAEQSQANYSSSDSQNVLSSDMFFCTADSLRIRSEPSIDSIQIGSLRLFDMAEIIEKTENRSIIDTTDDFWYKIDFNGIEGYVFGGYGVIIKDKYVIKTINDFANILPSQFQVEEVRRLLITWVDFNKLSMIELRYDITFMEHQFSLWIFYRPSSEINASSVSTQYNLEIINANNEFGLGDSYRLLNDHKYSSEIRTNFGNVGRYFFRDWGSGFTYDIANFLFPTKFDGLFDGILITPFNLWLGGWSPIIRRFDATFIYEARINRIRESILFHIFYEIVLRLQIE